MWKLGLDLNFKLFAIKDQGTFRSQLSAGLDLYGISGF